MNRRSLLVTTGLGIAAPLGGCTADESDEGATTASRPDECPVTRGFGVTPPDEISERAVQTFVREYERAYLNESRRSVPNGASPRVRDVEETNGGIIVRVQTTWSTTTLMGVGIAAEPQETVPEGEITRSVEALPKDLERVADVAREAVAADERTYWSHEGKDREPILSALDEFYERGRDDTGEVEEYYVTVDDEPVLVEVTVANEGIDDGDVPARYYVDEAVVRRTNTGNPRDGELLECLEIAD